MYFKNVDEVNSYYITDGHLSSKEWLVFLADKSDFMLDSLIEFCNAEGIELLGGIYPGLLVKSEYHREGLIVIEIKSLFKTKVLPHMMKSCNVPLENKTAIVLADGLSPHFKVLIDTLYNKLGRDVTYAGGGAGYYDLVQRPCIFDNKGLHQDVALVAILDQKSVVEYRHGWERVDGPFVANNTLDNVLSQIDHMPAFELYQDVMEDESINVNKGNFQKVSKAYPFGIDLGQEVDIVRDPIMVNDKGEITCVAGIPEDSDIYILKGNVDTLLKSSLQVAKVCSKHSFKDYSTLLFDCISRAMYLEDSFNKELGNIQLIIEKPVYGALSIGEISSLNNRQIQIHNKSAVLAVIEK